MKNVYYDSWETPNELVSIGVFIRVGSLCETSLQNGYSHFLEHMLFTGTKDYPTTKLLNQEILKMGCEYNAHTSYDYTGYYITCQKSNLDRVIKLLNSMIFDPIFNINEFNREKNVICQEIELSGNKSVMYLAHKKLLGMIYGRDKLKEKFNILGTKKSIQSAPHKRLIDYHKSWYHPDKLFMVISGAPGKKSNFPYLKEPYPLKRKHLGPKLAHLRYPDIDSGYIYTGFYTVDIEKDVKTTIILELFLKYLCRSFNSVLHQTMRIESGLSYSIRCLGSNSFFNHLAGGYGYKGFVVSISSNKIGIGMKKIKTILKQVMEEGIKDHETLSTLKNMFITGFLRLMQTTLNRVFYFATIAMKYPRLVPPEEIISTTKKITVSEFNNIVKKILSPKRVYTILIKK
jgi:predicted Zn-dependent peptidase